MAQYEIKLVRGLAGVKKTQLAVIESLGLRKMNDVVIQPDNAATKGKIFKVSHLVQVTQK